MGDHKECMRSHSNWQQRWPVVTIAVSLDGVGQEGQDVATLLTAGGDGGQDPFDEPATGFALRAMTGFPPTDRVA